MENQSPITRKSIQNEIVAAAKLDSNSREELGDALYNVYGMVEGEASFCFDVNEKNTDKSVDSCVDYEVGSLKSSPSSTGSASPDVPSVTLEVGRFTNPEEIAVAEVNLKSNTATNITNAEVVKDFVPMQTPVHKAVSIITSVSDDSAQTDTYNIIDDCHEEEPMEAALMKAAKLCSQKTSVSIESIRFHESGSKISMGFWVLFLAVSLAVIVQHLNFNGHINSPTNRSATIPNEKVTESRYFKNIDGDNNRANLLPIKNSRGNLKIYKGKLSKSLKKAEEVYIDRDDIAAKEIIDKSKTIIMTSAAFTAQYAKLLIKTLIAIKKIICNFFRWLHETGFFEKVSQISMHVLKVMGKKAILLSKTALSRGKRVVERVVLRLSKEITQKNF